MTARIFNFPTFDRGWVDAANAEPHVEAAAPVEVPVPVTRGQRDREWADALGGAALAIAFALGMVAGSLLLSGAAILVAWWHG